MLLDGKMQHQTKLLYLTDIEKKTLHLELLPNILQL